MTLAVGIVDPTRTFSLRQRVLRPHQSLGAVAEEANMPGAVTFGASEEPEGPVLSTATIYRERPPDSLRAVAELATTRDPWRLRAVATEEGRRSQGLGKAVMAAIVDYLAERDDAVLWCYARLPAKPFYLREGFYAFGEVFVIEEFGPHIVMYRTIDRRRRHPDSGDYSS